MHMQGASMEHIAWPMHTKVHHAYAIKVRVYGAYCMTHAHQKANKAQMEWVYGIFSRAKRCTYIQTRMATSPFIIHWVNEQWSWYTFATSHCKFSLEGGAYHRWEFASGIWCGPAEPAMTPCSKLVECTQLAQQYVVENSSQKHANTNEQGGWENFRKCD
jgi:hypothetical protein